MGFSQSCYNHTTVNQIFSIGNQDASLSLSGQFATISLSVVAPNGSTADIYRSPNVDTPYTKIAACNITNNLCTFSTDHFSLFAIGNVQIPYIPSTISSGPGGGGGGTYIPSILSSNTINPELQVNPNNNSINSSKTVSTLSTKKTIPLAYSTPLRNLIISIRAMQVKLDKKTTTGTDRYHLIISLQDLYRNQIQLMRGIIY